MRIPRRLLLAATTTAIAAACVLAYFIALPWIVRREVSSAFQRAGIDSVTFKLQRTSLFGFEIEHLTAGGRDLLKIGALSVEYAPLRAIFGELDTVRIADARLRIDLDALPKLATHTDGAGPPGIQLPFQRVEVGGSELVLVRGAREFRLPVSGMLFRAGESTARLDLDSALGGAPLLIRATIDLKSGQIDATAGVANADVAPLAALLPASVAQHIESAHGTLGISATFSRRSHSSDSSLVLTLRDGSLTTSPDLGAVIEGATAAVQLAEMIPPSAPPGQTISVDRIKIGDMEFADAALVFGISGASDVNLQQLSARFAGGVVRAAPFHFNPSHPVIATTLSAENLDFAQVASLLTEGRGSASGRISGSLALTIDPARFASADALILGEGSFTAAPGGKLRLGDATEGFENLLEQSNPAFAEPEMADVKQDILQAVRDFDYDLLDVRFARRDGREKITMRLHGRGRTGGRLPINLGVGIEGGSTLINDYLAVKSRVFSSATTKDSP